MNNPHQLVGLSEIAFMAHCSKQAIMNWRRRHAGFPQPIQELDCGPIWDKGHIEMWLAFNQSRRAGNQKFTTKARRKTP